MLDKTKLPVIILILLLIVSMVIAAMGFMALERQKQNSKALAEKAEDLEVKKRYAEKQVDKLKQQLADFETRFQDLETQITLAKDELEAEKKAKEEADAKVSKIQTELDSFTEEKKKLEAQLKDSEEELSSLREELGRVKSAKEEFAQKLKELEEKQQSVQLEKIVVPATGAEGAQAAPSQGPQAPGGAPTGPAAEGKILVINKEYDFVVVNLGQKDNLKLGDALIVFRGDKELGEIKVEEVRDTMSVATPLSKDILAQLKEEDRVVLK